MPNIEKTNPPSKVNAMSLTPKKPSLPSMVSCLVVMVTVATLFMGCASLDQLIQKPTASFSEMRLSQADLLQSTAVFGFNVNNPNPIPIHARRITYNLKLNGRHFVSGELDQGLTLAAGATSRMQVPVTMRYLDFFDSLSRLWKTKSADYALNGGFTVGPFTIPFQAHGNFELPKMPKISLESVKIDQLTASGARLHCRLKMDNPNTFQLLLKRLDYKLKLGDTSFASASALPDGSIAANSVGTMNFGFNISFVKLGYSAYRLLLGSNADYRLDGAMVINAADGKENNIPIKATGRVPFLK